MTVPWSQRNYNSDQALILEVTKRFVLYLTSRGDRMGRECSTLINRFIFLTMTVIHKESACQSHANH